MMMIDPIIALGARLGLILLFSLSALHKAVDMDRFRQILTGYRLLPESSIEVAAQFILATEVLLGIWLLVLVESTAPFWLGLIVLTIYTGAIAINLVRGNTEIDCGCLGSAARARLSPLLLFRNLLLLAATGAALLPSSNRPLTSLDVVTASGVCLVAAILYAGFDKAAANLETGPGRNQGEGRPRSESSR